MNRPASTSSAPSATSGATSFPSAAHRAERPPSSGPPAAPPAAPGTASPSTTATRTSPPRPPLAETLAPAFRAIAAAARRAAATLSSELAPLRSLLPDPNPDVSARAVALWPAWQGAECPLCGDFTPAGPAPHPILCPGCLGTAAPFPARSLFPYEGPAGEAIRAIKYGGRPVPARALAARLVDEGIRDRWRHLFPEGAAPVVVPVPIRSLKYLLRGFNLPSLVAVEVARATGWRCEAALLERASERSVQAALATGARKRNVAHAFACPGRRGAPGEVLLLDDVYTSGATAGACVAALKRAGAQHIVVVTVARAVLYTRHPPETP